MNFNKINKSNIKIILNLNNYQKRIRFQKIKKMEKSI